MMRWFWINFQCRGVLLIWIIIGHWPTALVVGAGGGCLDSFTLSFYFSSFSLSLETEILSQRAIKAKAINQPTTQLNIVTATVVMTSIFRVVLQVKLNCTRLIFLHIWGSAVLKRNKCVLYISFIYILFSCNLEMPQNDRHPLFLQPSEPYAKCTIACYP